jgi:hypothetical protein
MDKSHLHMQAIGLTHSSSQPLDSSNNVGFFADFLFWWFSESGTDNWAQNINNVMFAPTGRIDIFPVDFHWEPGFRIGVNYDWQQGQWDTQLYYTWYRTVGSDHVSGNEITSSFLGNFYINNANGAGISGPKYRKAAIRWRILYNIFDWDIGRSFLMSRALSMRPFIGLRGGWIDQKINSKWEDPILTESQPVFTVATENLKNDFWGIGPSAGLNTKWILGHVKEHSFSLFGDFSTALMFGHWSFSDTYKNNTPAEVNYKVSSVNGLATMFKSTMGLKWEVYFNQRRSHFALRLGYEMQFWLDQLQYNSFNTGRFNNELTLEGGTIDFRVDF